MDSQARVFVFIFLALANSAHSTGPVEVQHGIKVEGKLPAPEAQALCRQGKAESDLGWEFPDVKAQKAGDCYAYAVIGAFEAGLTRKTLTRYSLNEEYAVCAQFRSTPYVRLKGPVEQALKNRHPVNGWVMREFADFMKNNPDHFRWKEEISPEEYRAVSKEALRANLEGVKNAIQHRRGGSLKGLSHSAVTPAQVNACYESQTCKVPQEVDVDARQALASLEVKDLLRDFEPAGARNMSAYARSYPAMKRRDEIISLVFNAYQSIPKWIWESENCKLLVDKLRQSWTAVNSMNPKLEISKFDDPTLRLCARGRADGDGAELKAAIATVTKAFPKRSEREKILSSLKSCDDDSRDLQARMIAKVCAGVPVSVGVDDDPRNPADYHAYIVNGITETDIDGQRYWRVRDSGTGTDLRVRVSESCRIKIAFTVE